MAELINIRIVQPVCDPEGAPLVGHEAIDRETGQLHSSLVEALTLFPEADLHITFERVWIERFLRRRELVGARERGES